MTNEYVQPVEIVSKWMKKDLQNFNDKQNINYQISSMEFESVITPYFKELSFWIISIYS